CTRDCRAGWRLVWRVRPQRSREELVRRCSQRWPLSLSCSVPSGEFSFQRKAIVRAPRLWKGGNCVGKTIRNYFFSDAWLLWAFIALVASEIRQWTKSEHRSAHHGSGL